MNIYARYNYFFDKETKSITKKAGWLVHEQKREPNRYKYLGSWFAHEKQPFILENQVVRNHYNDLQILQKNNLFSTWKWIMPLSKK